MPLRIHAVMLANSATHALTEMTREALESLHDCNHAINTILVESAENAPAYKQATVLRALRPFRYNAAMNMGLKQAMRHDADLVLMLNNDLVFHTDWLDHIWDAMNDHALHSASPRAPEWHCHESYPPRGVLFGHRTSYEFCGWCLAFRPAALVPLLPLDERYAFEWQDVALARDAQRLQQRHGLVLHAHVTHLLNKSHPTIPPERKPEMFTDGAQLFHST